MSAATLNAMKLVTAAEMRLLEKRALESGTSFGDLMHNAGRAVASEICGLFDSFPGKKALVLVGPGNNGGDGLVAARFLNDAGAITHVYLLAPRDPGDLVYNEALEAGISPIEVESDAGFSKLRELLGEADVVVDAIFGTGLGRPIGGASAAALTLVAEARNQRPDMVVIALDLPSGLNADSGEIDDSTLAVDYTITLGYAKRGFFLFPGADYTGQILVADIGIPDGLDDDILSEVIDEHDVLSILPLRPSDAHKGSFGKVMVVAGSTEFIGAASLVCQSAARAGAGLVTLAARQSLHPVFAAKLVETTHLPLPETAHGEFASEAAEVALARLVKYDAAAIGPGLGQSPDTVEFVHQLLSGISENTGLVLDADALNALSLTPDWWDIFNHPAVLTPHTGEFARLSGLSIGEILANRMEICRKNAALWGKVVILKGAHTVVASPDGRIAVSPSANPGLASGGTGDVLTGIITGLLAQGLDEFDAARAGVYIHAMAGESVRNNIGDTGMIASDLLIQIPRAVKSIKEHDHASCH
ncbi:NAD(P)H-hydrate epimerase [Dehalogenimonas formicexedens]|uniref:Bifunctional NAD(P)H-hydrate repair enzyme n=1 Tax=Dehalogenimonas formicexedens TaxID=1839801 RepID=A0A1P8F8W8_9CHLR|nr:NAD(P)H-hydrate dehydratase [Dehalogenimonas formicexedens]APV44883.1 NAD(P)H-hydrate epimerase [Dehalogenimonas formicexedens]